MATIVVLMIVGVSVTLAVRKIIRDKKSGRSLQCGGDCGKCRGCCH